MNQRSPIVFLFVFLLTAGWIQKAWAQCPNDNTFYTNLTPAGCPGTASDGFVFAGEYVIVNVVAGNTYTFSTCNSILGGDSQITLINPGNGAAVGYNDDACGVLSSVTWTATYTGTLNVLIDDFFCSNFSGIYTLTITCSGTGGGGGGSGGDNCATASPFCTGTTYSFPNNTNAGDLGTINCLATSPNPVWYFMEIEDPGNLDINIEQYDNFGFPIDVDFMLWGPFSSQTVGCNAIAANNANNNVDCSYSSSAFEQANIPNAQAGEVYILLLTNFANQSGTINFSSTAGSSATTNCDILCEIVGLTATPTACDPTTNTYELSGTITIENPPATGLLTISSSCGGTTTLSAPFPNTINYTLSGLNAAGGSCSVTATFSAESTCTRSQNFNAPASCASLSLNCPDYANISTSPTTACSNQTYYLEVENTACNGQLFFTVAGNYGSLWGDEISWSVTSNLSGATLASGSGNTSGANFSQTFGPFPPSIHGTILTLNVDDALGDGFDGVNGQIYVAQGANIIGGPISGEIGFGATTIFGANISISPATITINTPAGPVIQTVEGCDDFRVPLSVSNPNFCNTINVNLPWSVTCNTTGAVIANGSNSVTVYPTLPSNTNDVVLINWDAATCSWNVTGNNDCDAGDIGTVFSISPNPATLNGNSCNGGSQDFQLQYNGLNGGPNCCSTGGPLVPIEVDAVFNKPQFVVSSSPFGGINNAAYLSIPANVLGGNANTFSLNISLSGYCMVPFGLNTDVSFWVTVLVDGDIVSDVQYFGSSMNQTFNLGNLPAGFNSSDNIEIYIYPNAISYASNTVWVNYLPNSTCGALTSARWTASTISASLQVTFNDQAPTAASCAYSASANQTCCTPSNISNASATICSGGSLSALNTWTSAVAAANASCLVYSSVQPVAGSVLPDNLMPNGQNSGSAPIVQTVSAYAYCDADGSGDVNSGDTYTLLSSFSLTVNPSVNAGTSTTTTVCSSGSTLDLFGLLGSGVFTTGTWTGPSSLSGAHLGTFNPAVNPGGIYTYTVTGISPCPNASATVTVNLSAGADASFVYPGSPYCLNQSGSFSPTFSGTIGGTFSSTAGLSINPSTGAITPSSSTAGTYTVTYSLAASGGCPAFSTTATVVITNVPLAPSLIPNPICEGQSYTFTAGNGSWYEFTLNGVSQAPASTNNSWTSGILANGDEVCVISYPTPPFTFDGNIIEPEWGAPLAKSNVSLASGFGPNNNLDALYLKNDGAYVYGAVAGQTENGSNNRILLFIDSKAGGYNALAGWTNRSNSPYVSVENLNGGIVFDAGFEPDYILCMNQAGGIAYFDLYDMAANSNNYLGSDVGSGSISSTLMGYIPNGGSFNNNLGFEFAIPRAALGNPGASLKVFAMLVNDPGLGNSAATFLSNQFLTPANNGESNYGDGAVFFNAAAPNPITYNLSAVCSTETCITVTPAIAPVTGFSYTPVVCEDDANVSPVLNSGFTPGGIFSSTAGLVINGTTGEINVAASTPGTYTINYVIPAIGCNPAATGSFNITIQPTPTTTPIYHE